MCTKLFPILTPSPASGQLWILYIIPTLCHMTKHGLTPSPSSYPRSYWMTPILCCTAFVAIQYLYHPGRWFRLRILVVFASHDSSSFIVSNLSFSLFFVFIVRFSCFCGKITHSSSFLQFHHKEILYAIVTLTLIGMSYESKKNPHL